MDCVRFTCRQCQKSLETTWDQLGHDVTCPFCNASMRIQELEPGKKVYFMTCPHCQKLLEVPEQLCDQVLSCPFCNGSVRCLRPRLSLTKIKIRVTNFIQKIIDIFYVVFFLSLFPVFGYIAYLIFTEPDRQKEFQKAFATSIPIYVSMSERPCYNASSNPIRLDMKDKFIIMIWNDDKKLWVGHDSYWALSKSRRATNTTEVGTAVFLREGKPVELRGFYTSGASGYRETCTMTIVDVRRGEPLTTTETVEGINPDTKIWRNRRTGAGSGSFYGSVTAKCVLDRLDELRSPSDRKNSPLTSRY